jgi:hypothetical protein
VLAEYILAFNVCITIIIKGVKCSEREYVNLSSQYFTGVYVPEGKANSFLFMILDGD